MTRHHGHMHPRHAVRFPRTAPAPCRRRVLDVATALVLGVAIAAFLFIGLSGGFRP